ncbi:MAG: FHA domain-containing protein [Anaerolineales bacterium]|nr:FHA domain-containing protein [Anaerolineales bacterium]
MSVSPQYGLMMRKGPLLGKKYELSKALLTIGREVKNDIVINDSEVSRQHVRLTEQAGGYWVEDLASTNGAFINGQRLSGPVALRPGDIVGLGSTVELEYGRWEAGQATFVASPAAAPEPLPPLPVNPPLDPPAFSLPPVTPPAPAPVWASALPPVSAPAPGGFQIKPWMWAVGIGCAVLAACVCVVAVAAVLFMMPAGGSFGP